MRLRELIKAALQVAPNQSPILKELLKQTDVLDIPFSAFVLDSRYLANRALSDGYELDQSSDKCSFVLLKSHTQPITKSCDYAMSAAKNAAFILSEIDVEQTKFADEPTKLVDNKDAYACPVIFIPNLRDILGTLIQLSLVPNALRQNLTTPADLTGILPNVAAITGTNGKTTISQLLAQICELSELPTLKNSAVMGTAGNGRLNNLVQASHTTGDVLAVQRFVRQMAEDGVDVIALEASSHGLDQQRLQGVPVSVAIYSNLSRDHLDYHSDMQDYATAKAKLFDSSYFPALTHAVINIDDEFAPLMLETAALSGLEVWTYSLDTKKNATFKAVKINPSLEGVEIELATSFGTIALHSPLLGQFNVANLLAAVAGAVALGIPLESMPTLIPQLQGASGRMQRIQPAKQDPQSATKLQFGCFIVDYAHTPDALTQVLKSLKQHCDGELWAVFGCGGDRDSGKRPLMAQAGLKGADRVILTSDNPRSEDPMRILEDMQQGMTAAQHAKATMMVDRRAAILHAVAQAGPKDIVVIAGKGHETYQEVNGVRHNFDDRQVLQDAFCLNQ